MRRCFAIALMLSVAFGWASTLIAPHPLPPCCKAHGCTMLKRAAPGCAFARCGQNDTALDAKQFPAVVSVESGLFRTGNPSCLSAAAPPIASDLARRGIDHPPRLLV